MCEDLSACMRERRTLWKRKMKNGEGMEGEREETIKDRIVQRDGGGGIAE